MLIVFRHISSVGICQPSFTLLISKPRFVALECCMEVQVVRDREGLESLGTEWNRLLADSAHNELPLTHGWITAWWASFGDSSSSPLIVVVRQPGDTVAAIAPFMETATTFRGVPVKKTMLMTNGFSPYAGIIIRNGQNIDEAVRLILHALLSYSRSGFIEFTKVPEGSEWTRALTDYLVAEDIRHGIELCIESPFITLDTDWETFLAGHSRNFRKKIRKKLSRLDRNDHLSVTHTTIRGRNASVVDDMLSVSRHSWKQQIGADIEGDPQGQTFLLELCDRIGPTGDLSVWRLLKGRVPIAFELHVKYQGVVYPIRADYRSDFSDLSPGATLEGHIIRTLFDNKTICEYNSCGHTYDYLLRWSKTTRRFVHIRVFPKRFSGYSLYGLEYRVVPIARKVRDLVGFNQPHRDSNEIQPAPNGGKELAPMEITRKIGGLTRALSGDIGALKERQKAFKAVRPATSTLFLTYRCNSRCATCTFWKLNHVEEKKKEMDLGDWKKVIDQLCDAGVTATEVFGGNVLLRKQLLIDVLHYLKKKQFEVHLPTNQIGLDDEIAEAIVTCVDFVYISTDGVGNYQDTIRGIRGSAEKAESAIQRLLRIRGSGGPPPVFVCNTTVSKFNVDILERVFEYACAQGFDEIHFEYAGEFSEDVLDRSLVDGLRPTPYYIKQDGNTILVDGKGARRLKRSLKRIRNRHAWDGVGIKTLNIDILSRKDLVDGTIPHRKCYVERLEATIDPSGNLIACPFVRNYKYGNVLESGFNAVWNNEKHRRFRELQNGNELEMCRHCILGVERNPGITTSLRRIFQNRILDRRYRLMGNKVGQ